MFYNSRICARIALAVLFIFVSGCSAKRAALLQSRSIATPFPADSKETCSSLRQNLFSLRSDLRSDIKAKHERSNVLAHLSLQEHAKNIKHVSTPREKMSLLITSELVLVNEKEIWDFIENVDELDILGIVCRDLEETVSPGIGEGIAHADFRRRGEDFLAYLVFKNNQLYLVFAPNSEPVEESDRKTILNLLGHASKSAVRQGVKAAIP